MLYLIGLGLNIRGISVEALEALDKCKKIFLENYTVEFPYSQRALEGILGKKLIPADRKTVESDKLLKLARSINVALLVYGSPLAATTHLSLIEDARHMDVFVEVIDASSVFTQVAKTGLQLYKFGKTVSIPKWTEKFKPLSFGELIEDNLSINAHTLILADMGLGFEDAADELKEALKKYNLKTDKILICSQLGTKYEKIFYGAIGRILEERIKTPFCIIIPSKLHFSEENMLKNFELV
jgi:diphthine synthase